MASAVRQSIQRHPFWPWSGRPHDVQAYFNGIKSIGASNSRIWRTTMLALGTILICLAYTATMVCLVIFKVIRPRSVGMYILLSWGILSPNGLFCLLGISLILLPRLADDDSWINPFARCFHYPGKRSCQVWLLVRYGCQRRSEIYHDLDPQRNEIRLLTISPGRKSDKISCLLHHIELGDGMPRYEALSYTWGPDHSPRCITVNGSPFHVTRNLYNALRNLRNSVNPRVMWIDAICIDQSNLSERSQQVKLMRDIYTHAAMVDIWLGSKVTMDDGTVEFLNSASRDIDPKTWLLSSLETNAEVNKDHWKAILVLFEGSYWKRVWIIQEIACATSLSILCGTHVISWDVTVAAQEAWIEYQGRPSSFLAQDLIQYVERTTPLDGTSSFYWRTRKGVGPAELEHNRRAMMQHRNLHRGQNKLVDLLGKHWIALATNPRDKIYALVGLATDCQTPEFPIDYSLSTWNTYLQTIEYLLDVQGNLDIIALSAIWTPTDFQDPISWVRSSFPTWTPSIYWTLGAANLSLGSQHIFMRTSDTFAASSNVPARANLLRLEYSHRQKFWGTAFSNHPSYHNNRAAIVADGCRLDRISTILLSLDSGGAIFMQAVQRDFDKWLKSEEGTKATDWLQGNPKQHLIQCIQFLFKYFVLDSRTGNRVLNAGQVMAARNDELWRTLVYNRTSEGAVPPPEWASLFSVLINGPSHVPEDFIPRGTGAAISANDRAFAYVKPYLDSIQRLGQEGVSRCYFETTKGRLGVAYSDIPLPFVYTTSISVILGCNHPMVIKDVSDQCGQPHDLGQSHVTMHGSAYLHGYMYGKALEELNSGDLSLESFYITWYVPK